MRAAERDFIYIRFEQGLDDAAYTGFRFGRINIAVLDAFDPIFGIDGVYVNFPRMFVARVCKQFPLERASRSEDGDLARVGGTRGGLDGGLHANKGNFGKRGAQVIQRGGGRGIAGDDDYAAVLREEKFDDALRKRANFLRFARSIRAIFLVSEINEVVVWQNARHGAQHRKPADARIEQADFAESDCGGLFRTRVRG